MFFGCRGDGGFNGCCSGASSGDGGFNVATSQLPVREKVRPARPGAGVSAKKFALRTKNGPKMGVYGVPGEVFRGTAAERSVPGEVFRGTAAERSVPGEVFRGTAAERTVLGESCRTTTQARPLLGSRHLRSNREPTCWDHHEQMGMKKALPKECLVEMQNPHRWIAPRGAAARPEGLEPPTF